MEDEVILFWVQVVGLPVLIATAVVLAWQTNEVRKATRASVYQNIASSMLEIDQVFIANPNLRKYFYDETKIKETDEDFPRVFSVAEMIVDFADNVLTQKASLPKYPWHTWNHYFRHLRDSSPVLRLFYNRYKDLYPDTLNTIFGAQDATTVLTNTSLWRVIKFWIEFAARFVLWISGITFAVLTVLGVLPILPEPTSFGLLAWLYLFIAAALVGWLFDIRRLFVNK